MANKCGRLGSEITGVNLPCCSACHLHVCLALVSVSYSGVPRPGLGASLILALKELQPGPQVQKAALSPNLGPPDCPTWPLGAVETWAPGDAGSWLDFQRRQGRKATRRMRTESAGQPIPTAFLGGPNTCWE